MRSPDQHTAVLALHARHPATLTHRSPAHASLCGLLKSVLGLACCNVLVLLSTVPAHGWPGTLMPFPWQRPVAALPKAAACGMFDTGLCK